MRGHTWSNDIREAVIRASELGVDHTIMEAITGVSKRSIQRIISEPKHGDDYRQRCHRKKVLDAEHCHFLRGCIERNHSLYLDELRVEVNERFGLNISTTTIWCILDEMGYSRKKSRMKTSVPPTHSV
ncbi:hypothetical protein BDM02DRAFT_1230094 [Thelephora ganbajun]|uniref:Uncharacterized protein n=1 Tax=Thelephora ganbajun TaxID=370292 RepID=A0ACB6Z448_THEGA|nr:hypothetical protein BDM02DRAFT_1230094 [Thelephora ganbajun]